MDAFVSPLEKRLDEEQLAQLFELIEGAAGELEKNGILARLTGELAERVGSPDPETARDGRIAACRAAGAQLVYDETQLPRADGSVARLAEVRADGRYLCCLMLALQKSAEKLYASGITKYRRVEFFVRPDEPSAELEKKLETLSSFYERIDIIPTGGAEKKAKRSLFARLFRKRGD